jgi:hypothetical protein
MADITEIIEESAVQLEIVESGGGQIEVVGSDATIIEVFESGSSFNNSDLDVATETNIVTIETPSDSTIVNISQEDTSVIETTITNNIVEIQEIGLLNIATQSITQHVTTSNVFQTIQGGSGFPFTGSAIISGSLIVTGALRVSTNLFTQLGLISVDNKTATFTGNGVDNIINISSGSTSPITINSDGLIVFDNFTYTPTPVEGGFLYSGSEFFVGLE